MIVDAYDGAGKSGDLAEADEDGLVDLALRREERSGEEQDQTANSEHRCRDELYDSFLHRCLKFCAKIQQKTEPTKKWGFGIEQEMKSCSFIAIHNHNIAQKRALRRLEARNIHLFSTAY